MSKLEELHSMFYPRSVAVVGVSTNPQGWGGHAFIRRLKKVGFPGDIYAINPKATNEVHGVKAYPSVKDIPEPPDMVMVSVPARRVPEVLEDCIAAGVKNVHIFSSGFSETQEEEGRQLEARIVEIRMGGTCFHQAAEEGGLSWRYLCRQPQSHQRSARGEGLSQRERHSGAA